TVSGGTLSNFSFSDGNSTGSATFTANDNSTTTGSITVNADSYTDSVGNTGTSGSDNVTVDTANPTLSDANISISGASGTGGAFKIGDTVTATWDNTANGDNNSDIASVSVDFSAFGSSTTVTANNTANTWTATYTIVAGTINSTNLNISVTATDSSDNTTTTVDTSNATVDNQAPTVSVTIVDSSLNDSDNQSSVTFAFSENITGFTESDLTVVGGTISDFSFSDSSNTASATFTANDSSNTNGSVTVNTDSYTDLVGNTGTNGTDTVTVDTTNPTVTVDITDTSLNNTDKSSNVTFTFSENITGFIEADLTIAGGTISNFSFSDNSNSGTATFTADDNTTTTGSITVNADSYTNLVGNTGTSGSDTIAIDTVNPSLTSFTRKTPPDESTNADTLTFLATFSEDVTGVDNADFTANGVTGSTINVTQVTASTYDIQLSGGDLASFNGTVSLDLNSPSITDLANNALPTNEPSTDESYTVSNYTLSIATTTHGSENGSSTPTHIVFTITTSPSNASGSAITGSIAYTGTAMSGTDYTAGVNSFSIADGASSTTVTLTVTEDYSVEGTETVIATIANPSRGSITNEAATATIADDDSANLALSKTTVTVNESGTTDTFTIALTSQPSSDVIIDLSNNDTEEASINPTQVTFSNSNWNTPQTVTVMGLNDNEQDGNQTLDLTIAIDTSNSDNTYSNLASQTVTITVEDDDIDGAEIDVQGGITPMTIADGDTSPHTVDDTDFGASTITKTFTIHNLGSADLTLTGAATVTLVNQNDSAFEITQTPNSSTLAIGTSATFAITFTPPASGISIATVVIESNDSNESLYSFNIQGRASQTLTPPRIEKLRAYLNDDADKNVLQRFQNVGGSIRFAFDLIDSDDGSYVYEWSSSNTDFNTLLSALSVSSSNGVITSSVVDISNLVAGIYPMTIRVSDSTFTSDPSYKAQANYLLTIVNEAVTNDDNSRDNDNDGIVNAHDSNPNEANHIPARLSSGNHYLAQVETGYRLLLGDTTKAAQRTGIKISQTDLASYGHEGHSANNTALSNQTLNHIFDYVIEGIPILDTQAGTSVRVVLPLETPLQSNSTFHKYNPTSGWSTVTGLEWADWDGGQAGICPNPDSTAYNNTTSQTGKTCLRMTLQDGGTYDQDGLVNGRIVDPLGIATPTPTSSGGGSSSSSSSCLLEGTPTHVSQINENPQECSDGGYKTHYFFLALDNPLDVDASVTYSTLDGTATAGEDYVAVSGTATIPAGAQYAAIPVQLIRDNVAEPDETFALVIQNPMGGTFPMDSNEILATHVIRDDDRSGSAYLEAQPSQSHHVITRPLEGNQNYTHYFLLELNQVLAQTAQLNYRTESGTAIADQDFIAAEGIITIPAGETHAIIGVTLIGDQGAEDDETFSVVITDPEGANFPDSMTEIRSTHTIVDDD
ncbi:MAG: Ig-like domain-containing protein, partial [bacterium]